MEIKSGEKNLIAFCGLYCGSCRAYNKGKCKGCQLNENASWCKIRQCCMENNYLSCAECKQYSNPKDCKKFNNIISRLFAVMFGSDRYACIQFIKDKGYDSFAQYMAENNLQTIKRK